MWDTPTRSWATEKRTQTRDGVAGVDKVDKGAVTCWRPSRTRSDGSCY